MTESLPLFLTRHVISSDPYPYSCTHLISLRIDPSIRLRRAIHFNDLTLLKRIVKNNPQTLRNPDHADNGNTSLHLAARLGLLEIAVQSPHISLESKY